LTQTRYTLPVVLSQGPGWRWVFYVNPPICVLVVAGVLALLANDRRPGSQASGFDAQGAVLVTGTMLLLVYSLVRAPVIGCEMTDSPASRAEAAPRRRPGKRDRLVAAASQLLHRSGVESTTLVDIAAAADVPPGNVYYYFKTKDEIVAAVVQAHVEQAKAAVAAIDERHRSPKSRLKVLLGELASQSETITQYGCPHGSLCSELDKRPGATDFALAELMRVPIDWAEQQFQALGRRDARDLAVSLLASYQGSALLSNTFRNPDILTREARRLDRWIDTL
jgi:TetR/AcrR family transcriptional regulator, transcriptional repressor for nem operon